MRGDTRARIRQGIQRGVKIEAADADQLKPFWEMMNQLCERRGVLPFPSDFRHLQQIYDVMSRSKFVQLFIGRILEEYVCGALGFTFGNSFLVWKIGWTGLHQDKLPNHLLHWECIKYAKARGLKFCDFHQIIPEHAHALLRGEKCDDHYWGVTHFKAGFGGTLTFAPKAMFKSYNPIINLGLRCGGYRFLESRIASQLGNRFLKSSE